MLETEWEIDYSTPGFIHPATGDVTPPNLFEVYLDAVHPGWRNSLSKPGERS